MLRICTLAISLLIGGCVVAPKLVDVSSSQQVVDLMTKWHEGRQFFWDRIEIISVNNKFVGSVYSGGSVRMDAGRNKVTTRVTFNRGFGTGPFEAFVTLDVDLPPTGGYVLNNEVDGGTVTVWIEDLANGRRVGSPGAAAWHAAPKEPTATPIFIPTKK